MNRFACLWVAAALGACSLEEVGEDRDALLMHNSSLEAIGHETIYPIVTQPDGMVGVRAGRSVLFTHSPGRPVPWALSVPEQMTRARPMVEAMHSAMDHQEHRWCAQALMERAKLIEDMRWSLLLRWKAEGDGLVVERVEFSGLPPEVDREARECYAEAFKGVRVPMSSAPSHLHKGDFYTQWTVCMKQPPADSEAEPSAEDEACYERRTCTTDSPCIVFLEDSPLMRQRLALECPASSIQLGREHPAYSGRGCRVVSGPPGSTGLDACEQVGHWQPIGAGLCRIISVPSTQGPGCCTVGCPPNLPQCRPELHHHGH